MTYLKTLARAAGIAVCVVAFAGTALAGGNGNENGNGGTPPGQEKKAEPAAPTPAQQAAAGQENKAENEAEHAARKVESKPAAASTAAKAAASGQAKKAEKADHATKAAKPDQAAQASTSKGQSANAHHHVIICHRTGSLSNPYVVINIPYTAWLHAHSDTTGSHPDLNGNHDKMLKDPASRPGSKDGFTKGACGGVAVTSPPTTQVTPSSQQTGNCPATVTTSEQVLVGIKHHTGSKSNPYVVISPSEKSAHMNGKHADDQAMYETRTVTRTVSGENCASVTQGPVTPTGQQATAQPTVQLTAQPVGEVAGAVSPANAKANAKASAKAAPNSKPAGGVLGEVASAPKAVAQTATSGTLPFTGLPLWFAALIGGALLATGLVLRRSTS